MTSPLLCMAAGCAREAVKNRDGFWFCREHAMDCYQSQAERIRAAAERMGYAEADPSKRKLIRAFIRKDMDVTYSTVTSALNHTRGVGRPPREICPHCGR